MKIIEKTFDLVTGEETITERDETLEEETMRLEKAAQLASRQEAEAAKAAEKQAILDQLGITAEQAKLLLS
jgi:hypothetical protein